MNNNSIQPIFIMPEGTQRTSGRNAQKNNILAAKLVAETVRTTLGPKGMDKMIVDSLGDITVTNDGVTILENIQVEHPAAKMVVEVAKTQEQEIGDGTTTAVVIAGELLKKAEELLEQEIHPTVIARGYRLAAEKALQILNAIAEPVNENDTEKLKQIALTAITGKGAEIAAERISTVAIQAVLKVIEKENNKFIFNANNIKLEKKTGGSVEETQLIDGIVLDKEVTHTSMPKEVRNAKIALIDSPLEIRNTEIDAKISITDPLQMQSFIDQEESMLKNMVNKIAATGANVVFCQKGIEDIAQHYLAKKGILATRRVKKSDMEALARATGASIVTQLNDLTTEELGNAGSVKEERIGEENMIYVTGCDNPKTITILIRGGTEHVVDEVKRALTDAIGDLAAALKTGKIVAGAGAPEIIVSKELKKYADTLSGREQLAVNAFADALEVIPRTLAENAGLDPIDVITELKAKRETIKWPGINVFTGKVMDSWQAGVIEPLKIKTQAISSASEVAEMILRIDDVIAGSTAKTSMPKGNGMPGPDMF